MEADRVIVDIIARTEGFDAKVTQSATKFESGMKRIEAAGGKAEASIGKATKATDKFHISAQDFRAIKAIEALALAFNNSEVSVSKFEKAAIGARHRSQLLGSTIGSVGAQLSQSNSPFLILARQGPQVANAMRLVSLGVGTAGGVLGGVFVTATLAAVGALVQFLLKSRDTSDELDKMVDKLKEKARTDDLGRQAQEAFNRTVEGAAVLIRKMTDELNDQNRTLEHNIELKKAATAGALGDTMIGIKVTTGEIAEAIKNLESAERALTEAEAGAGAGDSTTAAANVLTARNERDRAEERVRELTSRLQGLTTTAEAASRALNAVNFPLFERDAKEAVDPIAAINRKFDDMAKSAKAAGTYTRALAEDIEKLRAGELKEARATTKPSGMSGREVTPQEAASIARAAGLQVNSVTRTYAEQKKLYDAWVRAGKPSDNPVAPPGTSAHEGAKGRWALDIQFGPGVTPELLKKVFAAQGISPVRVFKERGHFHASGSRSQADSAEAEVARLAEAELRREQAFQNEKASLNQDLLDARQALAATAENMAKLEILEIELARQKYDDNLQSLVAQEKLTSDEAKELQAINNERAKLRTEIVQRREQERRFREDEEKRQLAQNEALAGLGAQQDILESQEGLARTQQERREIELRLLDLQFQEERLRLEYIIAYAARLRQLQNADPAEQARADSAAAVARTQLGTLDERQANARTDVNRRTAGPIEDLFNSFPQTAEQINEALQGIAANGMQDVIDQAGEAGLALLGLGDKANTMAGRVIAAIIEMTLKMLIFKALSAGMGLFGGSGPSEAPISLGSAASLNPLGGGRATGGNVVGGTTYLIGERGPELWQAPMSGKIVPNNAIAARAGGDTIVQQTFVLDARHGITTPELLRHVNRVASTQAARAGKAAFDAGQKSLPQSLDRFNKLGTP